MVSVLAVPDSPTKRIGLRAASLSSRFEYSIMSVVGTVMS